MEFVTILFYLFAILTLVSSIAVISARNPVYSVLWLIFAFFNSAGLFVLLGAEMLAMLLVIVYVGAVAVLFLFVVMMLNIKIAELKKGFQAYLPIGLLMALILFAELSMAIHASSKQVYSPQDITISDAVEQAIEDEETSNVKEIGRVLYTDYILIFQASGLILFVAMIGAIVLTLRHRDGVRKQNPSEQSARKSSVKMMKVESGKGIS
jgi:NADH-quinone oxidoreductase subunit J